MLGPASGWIGVLKYQGSIAFMNATLRMHPHLGRRSRFMSVTVAAAANLIWEKWLPSTALGSYLWVVIRLFALCTVTCVWGGADVAGCSQCWLPLAIFPTHL